MASGFVFIRIPEMLPSFHGLVPLEIGFKWILRLDPDVAVISL